MRLGLELELACLGRLATRSRWCNTAVFWFGKSKRAFWLNWTKDRPYGRNPPKRCSLKPCRKRLSSGPNLRTDSLFLRLMSCLSSLGATGRYGWGSGGNISLSREMRLWRVDFLSLVVVAVHHFGLLGLFYTFRPSRLIC